MSKKKNGKKGYKLLAFEPTTENIEMVQGERFYRITTKYILLYCLTTRFTNYNVIGEDELSYMSLADKQWLLDCNMAIIAEETVKYREEIAGNMGLMVDRLEEALKAEKAKDTTENARE